MSTSRGHDPGYGGAGGATYAFHNDSIQTGGGVYQLDDSRQLHQRAAFSGARQPERPRSREFDDLWMAGSKHAGILVGPGGADTPSRGP